MSALIKTLETSLFINTVKTAFFPAVLIFSTKIISLLYFSKIYNLTFYLGENSIRFNNLDLFISANDYSNIITFLSVFSFLFWLLIKGLFFHKSHISPVLSAWLHMQELAHLISDTKSLFIDIFVWLGFSWITFLLIFIHFIIGITSLWVVQVSFILNIIATIIFVIDLEREYKIFKIR